MRRLVLATVWGLSASVVVSAAAGGPAAVESAAAAAAWFDHPVNVWVTQGPREGRSPAPKLQCELGAAYDSATGTVFHQAGQRVVAFGSGLNPEHERTWIFDFKTGEWRGLDFSPHPPAKREGNSCTFPVMAYDSRNGVVLCVNRYLQAGWLRLPGAVGGGWPRSWGYRTCLSSFYIKTLPQHPFRLNSYLTGARVERKSNELGLRSQIV